MPAIVTDSRSTLLTDPLRGFRFQVNINHITGRGQNLIQCGFTSADGFGVDVANIAYREGGMNTTTQKMPGQAEYGPITLQTGRTLNKPHIWTWMEEIQAVVQGTGAASAFGNFRSDVDIYVLQHPWTLSNRVPILMKIKVYNAWPSSFNQSGLDAGGQGIILETLTLQNEGWRVSYGPGGAADAPNIV